MRQEPAAAGAAVPSRATVRGLIRRLERLLEQAGAEDMPVLNREVALSVEDQDRQLEAGSPLKRRSWFPGRPGLWIDAPR